LFFLLYFLATLHKDFAVGVVDNKAEGVGLSQSGSTLLLYAQIREKRAIDFTCL
jgi:hypothetical protein